MVTDIGENGLSRETSMVEGVCVVRLRGRARGALVQGSLERDELARLLQAGERQFVFNLSGLHFLDSASMGDLLAFQKQAAAVNGHVRVVLSPAQRKLVRAVKLDTLVEIFDDEDQALDAARANRS